MRIEFRNELCKRVIYHGVVIVVLLFLFSFFDFWKTTLAFGALLGVAYIRLSIWIMYLAADQLVGETRKNYFALLLLPVKLPIVLVILYALYSLDKELVLGFLLGMGVLFTAPLSLLTSKDS
jgi:hypothetical protein